MTNKHPTQIAKTALFATLLGVAIPLAVQYLASVNAAGKSNFSVGLLIANVAFVLTALNFFHGKVVSSEDSSYSRRLQSEPGLALADFWLHALLMLGLVGMAVSLQSPSGIAFSNIAVRVTDFVLLLLMIQRTLSEDVRNALRFWLCFDAFVILVFGSWIINKHIRNAFHPRFLESNSDWLFGTDSQWFIPLAE